MGELTIPSPSFDKYILPTSVHHQIDLKFKIDLTYRNLELVCNSMTVIIHDISAPARLILGKNKFLQVVRYKALQENEKMKNIVTARFCIDA